MNLAPPRPLEPRPLDAWITALDTALRTLAAPPRATRPTPRPAEPGAPGDDAPAADSALPEPVRRETGALMRVNHVGEVCAQALYTAQALATRNAALRAHFLHAAREETDHLAWTRERIEALGTHPSWLNPFWYGGAFAIGLAAGAIGGDRASLGFVVETERQVEAHLAGHLERIPETDAASRAIVAQMMADEARHAEAARAAGAAELPAPIPALMRLAARVMTTVAHRI
ncbi:ubiquinone biosynthesis monooxygenase Coq7 [Tibeticola sediminis]|uniref:3-demethoxyubiquinol 3-hydroxylase n=1 Tax=Tibeticola sediminis TaxID=1917811 RepID=A0A3N4UST6_9BURK|nr:2-polyprenyl-3-methyl-6-methoxy-1,4-benzoquinone monooxygenase [Tibeticola sediminis]RPE73203.1 ubiquinone biosynthesis monooxygenase Coq7 [Tibeticola sediminis]